MAAIPYMHNLRCPTMVDGSAPQTSTLTVTIHPHGGLSYSFCLCLWLCLVPYCSILLFTLIVHSYCSSSAFQISLASERRFNHSLKLHRLELPIAASCRSKWDEVYVNRPLVQTTIKHPEFGCSSVLLWNLLSFLCFYEHIIASVKVFQILSAAPSENF